MFSNSIWMKYLFIAAAAAGVYYTYTTDQHEIMFTILIATVAAIVLAHSKEINDRNQEDRHSEVYREMDKVRDQSISDIEDVYRHVTDKEHDFHSQIKDLESRISTRIGTLQNDMHHFEHEVWTRFDQIKTVTEPTVSWETVD